ncbi:MAG: rod shape-determining protein RodA [Thermoflexales bacterium]|nr:rod shape-determining protein RodA [Thermoflexales bacterium]
MFDARLWRHFDAWLLLSVLLLCVFGVAMVYSATLSTPDLADYPARQAVFALVGLVAFFFMTAWNYRELGKAYRVLYAVIIALLLIALLMGGSQIGSVQRWVSFPLFDVQPAEPAKVLLIIVLASFLANHEEEVMSWRVLLGSLVLVAIPIGLVAAQPNLSTVIVLLVIWAAMVFAAGLRWYHVLAFGGLGVLATPLAWLAMKDYMRGRILMFLLDIEPVPGARYNLDQALISIGNGGLLGKGFAGGSQSQLHFLRVRHTDFIFSVIAEEMGLLGALCLFALFMFLLFRLLRIAYMARDSMGRYYVIGVVAMIFFTAVVNIAMNLSLMPVAGLPLPFVSYGGSSLLTLLFALGVAQSVLMRHKTLEF